MGLLPDRYNLLYCTTGVVYGVGYTAAHVTMTALWIIIRALAAACEFLMHNLFRPRWEALGIGLGVYGALYVLGVLAAPCSFRSSWCSRTSSVWKLPI